MMRNKNTKMPKYFSTRETSALGENNIERNWPTVRTKEKVLSFGGFVIEANVCGEYDYLPVIVLLYSHFPVAKAKPKLQ